MAYSLAFKEDALQEWYVLDNAVRGQFKNKLEERLTNPHTPASKLSGQKNRYTIKLRNMGFRLVYEMRDAELIVVIVAVGKHERNAVYKAAAKR
ncbi:type II toxin-antitoxin system RelE/ParE family toxin [Methylobacter svalbardensis]|uniref:type II toxin-antitoxin system RelE family toxin n=1 Tax=Methylobacter svalbardensis TaxID=3080016 RepID=UPI0030EB6884